MSSSGRSITPENGEDPGSLADLTTDTISDSTSLISVTPSLDANPVFPPTESPPPGYMSEDGDSHDLPDISDYSGELITSTDCMRLMMSVMQ